MKQNSGQLKKNTAWVSRPEVMRIFPGTDRFRMKPELIVHPMMRAVGKPHLPGSLDTKKNMKRSHPTAGKSYIPGNLDTRKDRSMTRKRVMTRTRHLLAVPEKPDMLRIGIMKDMPGKRCMLRIRNMPEEPGTPHRKGMERKPGTPHVKDMAQKPGTPHRKDMAQKPDMLHVKDMAQKPDMLKMMRRKPAYMMIMGRMMVRIPRSMTR